MIHCRPPLTPFGRLVVSFACRIQRPAWRGIQRVEQAAFFGMPQHHLDVAGPVLDAGDAGTRSRSQIEEDTGVIVCRPTLPAG